MTQRDPRVDAYVEGAAPFAKPILRHLRSLVHRACPDAVETIKWGMPSFELDGILCGMAAFKKHAVFGFWKHEAVMGEVSEASRQAMGSFGCLKSRQDLPSDATLVRLLKKAEQLNRDGVKVVRQKHPPRATPPLPADLKRALAASSKASATWKGLPPSARREYLEWVVEAKRPETRATRVKTSILWLSQGKRRNWKYEKR